MVVLIVLAVLFFLLMVWGIFLNRRRFKSEKINGTYVYRKSENIYRKDGNKRKKWGFGVQKLKGIRTSLQIRYKIPEFYKKLKNRDRQAKITALIICGVSGFVCCIFLAVGVGLLESGESSGWIIIAVVVVVILPVAFSHIKTVKNAEFSGEKKDE